MASLTVPGKPRNDLRLLLQQCSLQEQVRELWKKEVALRQAQAAAVPRLAGNAAAPDCTSVDRQTSTPRPPHAPRIKQQHPLRNHQTRSCLSIRQIPQRALTPLPRHQSGSRPTACDLQRQGACHRACLHRHRSQLHQLLSSRLHHLPPRRLPGPRQRLLSLAQDLARSLLLAMGLTPKPMNQLAHPRIWNPRNHPRPSCPRNKLAGSQSQCSRM